MRSYKILIHASTMGDAVLALEQIQRAISIGCTGIAWREGDKDERGGYSLRTDDAHQGGTLLFREPGLLSEEAKDRLRKLCRDGGCGAVSQCLTEAGAEFSLEWTVGGELFLSFTRIAKR